MWHSYRGGVKGEVAGDMGPQSMTNIKPLSPEAWRSLISGYFSMRTQSVTMMTIYQTAGGAGHQQMTLFGSPGSSKASRGENLPQGDHPHLLA